MDYDQLKKRKNEITSTIIDSVCSLASEADPNMPDLPDDDDMYDDMYDDYEINGRKEDQIKEVNTNYIFTFDEQLDGTGVQFMCVYWWETPHSEAILELFK